MSETLEREDKIRRRAEQLWREAGEPHGQDEQFWHHAEREIDNEGTATPLETPPTTPSDPPVRSPRPSSPRQ